MIPFEIALGTALRHWKLILSGLLVMTLAVALLITRATLANEKSAHAAERAAHAETIANYKLAQEVATVKAERQQRETEDRYRRNADEAEDLHAAQLASATDAAERYIAANRVRSQSAQCPSSGSAPATTDQRASVPADVPAAPELVTITPEDVRACSAAVTYADQAHSWATTLNQTRR